MVTKYFKSLIIAQNAYNDFQGKKTPLVFDLGLRLWRFSHEEVADET